MRILLVGPIERKITSNITAARPRLVFDLASGLVKRRHKVTILGTDNSYAKGAKIIPAAPKGFIEMGPFENEFTARCAYLVKQAKILEKIGSRFDIIHNHSRPEFFNLFAAQNLKTPMLTTLHGVMEKETDEVFSLFKKLNLICISKAAARLAKKTKVYKIIHNGVDTNLYRFEPRKNDYLLWIGRLSKAKDKKGRFLDPKGVRWAIKLARATGQKLLLAGNVEDRTFFDQDVRPYLSERIKWVCPMSEEQPLSKKQVVKLMAKAKAFLMTVNWQEPFGLVMIEAMACGTPVIGFGRGSVPEVVKHGRTGFVVPPQQGLAGLKNTLSKINQIKSRDCRDWVVKNFSLEKMVDEYEKTYFKLIKGK